MKNKAKTEGLQCLGNLWNDKNECEQENADTTQGLNENVTSREDENGEISRDIKNNQ